MYTKTEFINGRSVTHQITHEPEVLGAVLSGLKAFILTHSAELKDLDMEGMLMDAVGDGEWKLGKFLEQAVKPEPSEYAQHNTMDHVFQGTTRRLA